jgi:dephospho-CoA kinase
MMPTQDAMAEKGAAKLCVGLTGGIGCGKSLVSDLFAERGASIIDTDRIAHDLTGAGGAAMPALVHEFGASYVAPDGALDRARMRALVFKEPQAKARLEAILHPRIRAAALACANHATGCYVIFAVPLLIESGSWRERVTRVLVIDCPENVQIARVMARNGYAHAEVAAIMATQATRQARLAQADDVIDNSGGIAALAPQIDRLHAIYADLAERMARMPPQHL